MPFTSLAITFLTPLLVCDSVNVFIFVQTIKPRSYYIVTFHMEHNEGHRATFLPEGKSTRAVHFSDLAPILDHCSIMQCFFIKVMCENKTKPVEL